MGRSGLVALVLVLAWSARAEGASALAAIVPQVASGLGAVPAGAMVVAAPLASDVPAPKGDELVQRIAALVAGRLGAGARVASRPAPLPVARAVASKGSALVYVQVSIARGALRATTDLYPVLSNAWDRARAPAPGPRAHAFAAAPLDAEVRAFLSPLLLEQTSVHKAKHELGEVLAAACGDVDGDGGMDLVLASRERVAWGHLRGGSFVAERAADWATLARRAPVPLREPLASIVVLPRAEGGGDLYAGTTDRGGVALSRDLLAASALAGIPVTTPAGVACASPDPAASALVLPLVACEPVGRAQAPAGPDETALSRVDAYAVAEIVGRDGATRVVSVAREPGGKLTVRFGDASLTVADAGAQVAAADLDQDGAPEIVTTTSTADDAVMVSSLRGNDLRPRLKLPAPGGVRAVAACPPEVGGAPALVAVVGAEVWVVR